MDNPNSWLSRCDFRRSLIGAKESVSSANEWAVVFCNQSQLSPTWGKKPTFSSSSLSHSTPNWSTSDFPELIKTPIYSICSHTHYISSRIQPNGLRRAVNASLGSLSLPAPQSCSSDLQFYLTIFVSLSTPPTKALELPLSKLPEGALQRPQRTAGAFVATKKKKNQSLDSSPPLRFSHLLHSVPPPFDLSP